MTRPPSSPNDPSGSSLILASPLPIPPKKQKPTLKRPRSPSPDIEPVAVTTAKRARVNGAPVPASANGVAGGGSGKKRGNDDGLLRSPSKRQRLEEDGVVIMENDDDVIVIED
jgi:ubiquitin-like 1-activating enzyme E1 B